MADHNYCDNVDVLKVEASSSESEESRNAPLLSDDPDYELPNTGVQTRLRTKKRIHEACWTPVRTAPGLRPNCVIYYDGNGFAYHNHKIANNKKYLKCTQKSIKNKPCPARAVIRNQDNMIRHSGEPHTHKPRNYEDELLKRNFLMKIRERAISEYTPNRKIFDEEMKKTPKLRGKVSFSSTARRMQRFRQPQKMQGPLFPIEDNELLDAINDYKNIPNIETNNSQASKNDLLIDEFDAASHMEVIEVNDLYTDSEEYFNDQDDHSNMKENKENITLNTQKESEKTVNMFCCIYCNKWQEAQVYEFVPNEKSKIIEPKEKVENKTPKSLENISSPNVSNITPIPTLLENITPSCSQKIVQNFPETSDNISNDYDDHQNSFKQVDPIINEDSSLLENDISDSLDVTKSPTQERKNKPNKKLGFLQMRIDSTIYFDNMGYSYQIQNEKNDKKYLRCVVWGKKKCPGRAHLNKTTLSITRSRGHNHLPSTNCDAEKQARAFLHAIKGRAQDETTSLRTIYEEEIKKFPLAASVVNYANATRRMQRTRRLKHQPDTIVKKEPPLLLSVQVIPGTRRGTSLYMDELGYYYHNDTLTSNGKIVRCTKNRKTATEDACHSRGFLRASGDGFVIYRTKNHNHSPGDLKRNPMERSFINTLCERAKNDLHMGLKDIYSEEVERFLDVADKIPYRMAWRSMARMRQPPKASGDVKVVNVSVVSGHWEGYTLYRDEIGFLYSMRKGRKFVWCHMNTKLKCLVKGSITSENDVYVMEYTGEHNHPPLDNDEFQAAIFIEKIMLRCVDEDSKPKKLYEEEIINFPGVEKRVTLAYAREKIKARRKSSLKKNQAQEILQTTCEPLQFFEFWGAGNSNVVANEDDITEDIVCSDDEEYEENNKEFNDVYSDELGYQYSLVSVKNNTRYLECIDKGKGCLSRGEMFKGENSEWLFVQHRSLHNHPRPPTSKSDKK
ncbi:uncharacterized protein LOC126846484 isoform X2 [Adelges cooleyi]|uniref:uncharacterized protein LOC126846484 isoform X2 n=1 Tax=Adelges cooleyi TaxID=133065 RepID=UPI00218009B4|nr:uncharacterized protein LOC126846484 isoform X2 [Adelges cooleyi]